MKRCICTAVFKCIPMRGCEIASVKLSVLQEIALFAGTLRFNLDPMDKYSDDHIWECIRNAKMNDYIEKMPNGLETQIETDGLGLSNGEKQVISCLRGLLSNNSYTVFQF